MPGGSDGSTPSTPRDVQVIQSVLKDMGVTEYEPAVISQLLDFCYKYTTDILEDAKAFSNHANKKSIDIEDTKLAVQLKLDKSYTNPPPRELLMDIAAHRNTQPLPLIKPYTGPKLPPDRYCLSAVNYQLKKSKKPTQSFTSQTPTGLAYQRQISSKSGSLLHPISLVGKQVISTSGTPLRQVKTQIVTSRPTVQTLSSQTLSNQTLTATGAAHSQSASQGASATASLETSQSMKRKLEPDDDYDT